MNATIKLLTRAQVLGAKDIVTEDVSTPEWAPEPEAGQPPLTEAEKNAFGLRIRNLTGAGRGAFIQRSLEMKKAEDNNKKVDFEIEMLLICMTAVDAENNAIFTEEDVKALASRNANPIARCAAVAQRLSAIGKAETEAAEKNLRPAAS